VIDPTPGVRLLGVGISGLAPGEVRQMSLEDLDAHSWDDASVAVDRIRRRFGPESIGPATLAGPGGFRVKRRGDQQWGPGDESPGGGPGDTSDQAQPKPDRGR
jgi:hypothetical protein